VDFLYSLYDALVSINVPSDKARAVVDAMERDMGTTLATKQDLAAATLATKRDLDVATLATKRDLEVATLTLKQDLEAAVQAAKRDLEVATLAVKQDMELMRRDFENRFVVVDQRFDALELRMTVKMGSMIIAGFGLTIAAVRFWS
jgi:hypothetical protein